MSHNTTVQTKLTSKTTLMKALTEMGIAHQTGEGLRTNSTYRTAPPVKADITFKTRNGDTVGFALNKKEGTYECVGDFYSGIETKYKNGDTEFLEQKKFVNRVTQMSAAVKVKDAIRKRYGIKSVKYQLKKDTGKIHIKIVPKQI